MLYLSYWGILFYLVKSLLLIQTLYLIPRTQGFTVELRKYTKRIEKVLAKEYSLGKNSVDRISEKHWLDVVK
jgi:hypothetical protein